MLKIKFLVTFAAIMLLFSGGTHVSAQSNQEGLSLGPSTRPFGSNDDHFNDEELYEYDAQLWAPYDVTRVDGQSETQQGFYSRLGVAYISLSGPDAVPGMDPRNYETISGFNTARDFEFGYNTEGSKGWSLQWLDAEGSHYLRDGEFTNRQVFGGFTQPAILRTSFDDLSLNRQFRQRLSNGGYVEPFLGLRYLSLIDETNEDRIAPVVIPNRFSQKTSNTLIGGHLGTRYFRNYGRFRLGSDIGMGVFYNNQNYSATSINAAAPGSNEPAQTLTNRGNDFVPIFDLGLSINYSITRDVSFRVGAELHWAWQGLARADTANMLVNGYSAFNTNGAPVPAAINTEDFIAAGFTVGIDWRR